MRTSVKSLIAAITFLAFGVFCMAVADLPNHEKPKISFSGGHSRAWNHWDFGALGCFVLFASFSAVGLMFANKED